LKALQYLGAFPGTKRENLNLKYPGAGKEAIDMLDKMLQFNPYFRITIDEALAHPFFTKIRKESKEVESDVKINIEFDQSKETLDRKRLRQLFIEEIEFFKQKKIHEGDHPMQDMQTK